MIRPINTDKIKISNKIKFKNFYAYKLSVKDIEDDFEAVIRNEKLIKKIRGNAGSWPNPKTLSKEEDFIDLAWHQREFENNLSFAFVLRDKAQKYIGCAYIYPMNFRSSLKKNINYDFDFSFWVTQEFYDQNFYEKVYFSFIEYFKKIGVDRVFFSNKKLIK